MAVHEPVQAGSIVRKQEDVTTRELSRLNDRKSELRAAHTRYVEAHPELTAMLNEFVCALLLEKPESVFDFASKHFSSTLPIPRYVSGRRPMVMAGPSGAGKGTIIKRIMDQFPDQFGFSVSHTTRNPRQGEANGVHYNFTSKEAMQMAIDDGKFIEHAQVHGNFYGTSVEAVAKVAQAGKVCLLDIDIQGVKNVKRSSLQPYYVFISPPSMEILERRLRDRQTESEADIKKRLGNAQAELDYGHEEGQFDFLLVNDDLDLAMTQLREQLLLWYPDLVEGKKA